MKRALRIFVRLITLPVFIMFFILTYCFASAFVFQEWLFENADPFYSNKDQRHDFLQSSKKYIMNFFE